MRLTNIFLAWAVLAGVTLGGTPPAMAERYGVEYAFAGGSDGNLPESTPILYQGKLFGTTYWGGVYPQYCNQGCGTVYAFDPATGVETIVHAFRFRVDGYQPAGDLINVDGMLYGAIRYGGIGFGSVFALDPASGAETIVYSFKSKGDAATPAAGLIRVGKLLYGTTYEGGSLSCAEIGCGAVYSLDPITGVETMLYGFKGGKDGANPTAALLDVNGILYGTTEAGGSVGCRGLGCGTVFSIDPSTGAETVVYAFQGGSDGFSPMTRLINVGGQLYGTTQYGGNSCRSGQGCGTVFSVDPNSGAETIVHAFKAGHGGQGGWDPMSGLTEVEGTLYGTTSAGGAHHVGTVFSLDPTTHAYKVLHAFAGDPDGRRPAAGLVYADRKIFGTTAQGGGASSCAGKMLGCGSLFFVRP